MKISKFPLFSLVLLGGTLIYAVVFCQFLGAKILFDNHCKAFVQETIAPFLNDSEKAKEYKAPEINDETLVQLQNKFKDHYGQCKFKDISMLKGFQISLPVVVKTYEVTLDCEKKEDVSIFVTLRQKDNQVKYFGLRGVF